MAALSAELRKQLESTIKEARRTAEAAADRALRALAVDRSEHHGGMESAERGLRNRLRAHGRQLGDLRDRTQGTQEIRRLAHEVAYEHWHRMLFARFLAENQLLIEPDSGVAISMAECEELARARAEDPWVFAGHAASRMLPRIFRPEDPVLEVTLAPEDRQKLEALLVGLPKEVFTADDSLGWTYQFWQAERKDEVNASGVKIGAAELPAVTQLFTEHYMVQFLFHNTVGAWRAGKILAEHPEMAAGAGGEDELRRAVRLAARDGYEFGYLRFVREPEGGAWRPAAGAFDGWPRTAAELRILDPCCGSGHFLVEGLEVLVRLRMEEERLSLEDAIRVVLAENLYGLELDPRCTQIAAFALALAAWKMVGRPIELPPLQIACTGLAIGGTKREWLALAGGVPRLAGGMERLFDLFEKAPDLGSLIDPRALSASPKAQADAFVADFPELRDLLRGALGREQRDDEKLEQAVAAQGMARAAELLAGTYTLVITNVPYLGRGNQGAVLRSFAEDHYAEAKADLATMFVARSIRWLGEAGTQALVTPQNWLFLTSYRKLRERLLAWHTWNMVARLGEHAFESTSAAGAFAALCVLSADRPAPDWQMSGIDVSAPRGQRPIPAREKAELLKGKSEHMPSERDGSILRLPQGGQADNPDAVLSLSLHEAGQRLIDYADGVQGLATSDNAQFIRKFWEIPAVARGWSRLQMAPQETALVAGCSHLLHWQDGAGTYLQHALALKAEGRLGGWKSGSEAWGKVGVAVNRVGPLPVALYRGDLFDCNVAIIVPHDPSDLPAIWAFCRSNEYVTAVRKINQKLAVTNVTLAKVPFNRASWKRVADEEYSLGLPGPESSDPTQWFFHGHPANTVASTTLQVAVARLLGYRWRAEYDSTIPLTADSREWVKRCGDLDSLTDEDGVVCLVPLRGEASAADRMRLLLSMAFRGEWSAARERMVLGVVSGTGTQAESLEEWLRDQFFEEHCKLFHHCPIVWHVWDGRRDGFHALVDYHRLAGPHGEGRRTLEALTYSYLGDWIERQRAEQREGREGADARLAAALDLQTQLQLVLEGQPPYDLFVRWKPLHRQPLGWDPDIDDGVRLNIRPFMKATLRAGGRSGAGILRWRPNIKWTKDRGKEPRDRRPREDYPWFWACPGEGTLADRTDFAGGREFDGNRWNDLHYSIAAKQAARARVPTGGGAG